MSLLASGLSILPATADKIIIAYSGGIDSHVLLHVVASKAELKRKITAVYIDHGLQAQSADWARHCQSVATGLAVKFQSIKVNADKLKGQSQEEAARNARYQALESLIAADDVLLLAQHREDQMETVLLQLFRGAGVQGLSGMPAFTSFGQGNMCRPFLDCSKQDIIQYAKLHQLLWIEDPSNAEDDYDRNFLRNQVLPVLRQRWPAIDKTVSRSARLCAQSQSVTEEQADVLLDSFLDKTDRTLQVEGVLGLQSYKQNLLLRKWFALHQLRMPSEKVVCNIINEVAKAKTAGNPEIKGHGYRIKRYRDKLYCLSENIFNSKGVDCAWPKTVSQLQLKSGHLLSYAGARKGISQALWRGANVTIRYRAGKEKIKLPGRTGHHKLKNLFQESAIPPWQRENMPLIYLNNQLAAVADLWVSADFYAEQGECYTIKCIYQAGGFNAE